MVHTSHPNLLLRARVVLPVAGPPIDDGAIGIEGDRILSVSRWADLAPSERGTAFDLGDVVVLPGLVNAHCHLDYTHMAGKIPPLKHFTDWIKAIVALKAEWSFTEFAESWLAGAGMLLRSGTTTVADVEAVPELLPDAWDTTALRVLSFRELINLKPRPSASELIESAVRQIAALPQASQRFGLSPHAPYTTTPELLQRAARAARQHGWRLTTHVAESEAEFLMFMYRHGPLFDWLKSQRDMSDCGHGSPVAHLERCGYLGENLLAVHVNHLGRDDAALLARRKVSVVHCPSSHGYFKHLQFPLRPLAQAGVNLCLGTDSLASALAPAGPSPGLSMFAEMRLLAKNVPELSPNLILRMATRNGALALGKAGQIGELIPGALADLIVLPCSHPIADAPEAAIHSTPPVAGSMIGGRWVLAPSSLHLSTRPMTNNQ